MLSNFSLNKPPRVVPVAVGLRLLFGGFSNQFGWLFFGFGLIFFWVFGGSTSLYSLVYFSGELNLVEGIVLDVVETSVTVDEARIYEYQYQYVVNDRQYEGATRSYYGEYNKGDTAVITYSVANPARSRAAGVAIWDGVVWFTIIFPAVGLIFMLFGIGKAIKGIRLLRDGVQTTGTLISKEATNTTVNDQTVYKFTFRFFAEANRPFTVVGKTHVTERFAGEPELIPVHEAYTGQHHSTVEPLLYNPASPSDAVLLDDLPGGPRINQQGKIEADWTGMIVVTILPSIAVVGHGLWVLFLLEIL
ncbi:MAG: DUF3592 domain-containing protein [Chloroflexota bacterium]